MWQETFLLPHRSSSYVECILYICGPDSERYDPPGRLLPSLPVGLRYRSGQQRSSSISLPYNDDSTPRSLDFVFIPPALNRCLADHSRVVHLSVMRLTVLVVIARFFQGGKSRNRLFLYPIISRLDLLIHAKGAYQHKLLNYPGGRNNEKTSLTCRCKHPPMNECCL